jgi:hypothetical protein
MQEEETTMSDLAAGDDRHDVIRITRDEAYSSHVDDLLTRQASLHGETDLTVDRRGQWYYKNWFLFMVAGGVAALIAWAILEPHYNDYLYFQGPVTDIQPVAGVKPSLSDGLNRYDISVPSIGKIVVADESIWLLQSTSRLRPDGSAGLLELSDLRVGSEVGVYVDYTELGSEALAVAAWVALEPPQRSRSDPMLSLSQMSARHVAAGILMFPLVAGLVGLAIGATDGLVCRLVRRLLLAGGIGLLVGFIGGFVSGYIANLIYAPLNALAMKQAGDMSAGLSPFGFFVQMSGRALAWAVAGMAMGLGQGIALRSARLTMYGFLGGVVGGLLGGLLFDPIDLLILGADSPSAHWSRAIGFMVVGASVGCMIGVVELLARDAWLRMVEGPLAGKEFLLFKDIMTVGSAPNCEMYLFNDDEVGPQHAAIRAVGDNYEIEAKDHDRLVLLNGMPVGSARLRNGDQLGIGRTVFVFQQRKGS